MPDAPTATAPSYADALSGAAPAVDPSAMVSQSAPPSIPQAAPQQPQYDPSDEVQTERAASWAATAPGASNAHGDFLSRILHAVGEAIAPSTKPGLDANGNIIPVPQSTAQRVTGAVGRAMVGAAAGAAQRGPGSVGKAALAGVQATQEQQQQDHKDLLDRAAVAQRNNTWLLENREFDLRSKEYQQKQIDQDNALQEHMSDLGATKVPIIGVDGNDHNGTSNENELMQWRTNNNPAPGTHYVPVASLDASGKRVYTI